VSVPSSPYGRSLIRRRCYGACLSEEQIRSLSNFLGKFFRGCKGRPVADANRQAGVNQFYEGYGSITCSAPATVTAGLRSAGFAIIRLQTDDGSLIASSISAGAGEKGVVAWVAPGHGAWLQDQAWFLLLVRRPHTVGRRSIDVVQNPLTFSDS